MRLMLFQGCGYRFNYTPATFTLIQAMAA